jgi:N-acetylneuraminate synthase/sialic acid synthase
LKKFWIKGNSRVKIGATYVGPGYPTFFIAEIGINHNGDISIAKELILKAKKAGANAVKFQKRVSSEIFTESMLKESYIGPNSYGSTYGEHRAALEFSFDQYSELKKYADQHDILFFASVWDEKSVDFMNDLGVHAFKIASADAVNLRLIDKVINSSKPILISTGMSTKKEIELVVKHVRKLTKKFIFFHSTSLYPASHESLNLAYISKLIEMCSPNPIGYSGHEADLLPSLIAISLGATIIERHLTLDKNAKGSDHSASLLPEEFDELVSWSKQYKIILGKSYKPDLSEELLKMRRKLGKSLYYSTSLPKGHKISSHNIKLLSPGDGLSPLVEKKFVGRKLKQSVEAQKAIREEDF